MKDDIISAIKILKKLLQQNTPLSYLLTNDISPFTKELCYGVCRQYFILEEIANKLVEKKIKKIEIWLAILIGIYQLKYLKKPDYAVVTESVKALEKLKATWAKGLINAVLRNYCRLQNSPKLIPANDNFNHPQWLIEKLKKNYPKDWQNILKANDLHPPMSLRVNQKLQDNDAYLEKLKNLKIDAKKLQFSGIEVLKPCKVNDLPGFQQGEVSVQDEAAQLAASLLDLKKNLRVLDACAAPGSKLCHILETEDNLEECFGIDIEKTRLDKIRENLNRLNLNAKLIAGDSTKPKDWWDQKLFDRILLDAPCSATGVIRRHPDIKLLRTPKDIQNAQVMQKLLLNSLWPLLKPGGLFLYATCSILPEENEEQIKNFISKNKDCKVVNKEIVWGRPTGHGWQILPGDYNMDGFFYSLLIKI